LISLPLRKIAGFQIRNVYSNLVIRAGGRYRIPALFVILATEWRGERIYDKQNI
jgi:hypothetical protein